MTQDKMRRIITACVSAATILLVFLLGFLIYQWITIGVKNNKIEQVEAEIAALEREIEKAEEDADFYSSKFYLEWKIEEYKQKQDMIEGK